MDLFLRRNIYEKLKLSSIPPIRPNCPSISATPIPLGFFPFSVSSEGSHLLIGESVLTIGFSPLSKRESLAIVSAGASERPPIVSTPRTLDIT